MSVLYIVQYVYISVHSLIQRGSVWRSPLILVLLGQLNF